MIQTFAFPRGGLTNRYLRDLGMSGLDTSNELTPVIYDDTSGQATPVPAASESSSGWGNVLTNFLGPLVSPIGMGIGGWISGQNPWSQPPAAPLTSTPPGPSTTTIVLGAAGVVAALLLVNRLMK